MKLKKLLAVLLVAVTMLSVMTLVAYSANVKAAKAPVADEVPSTDTTEPTELGTWEKIGKWWAEFYPKFQQIWEGGFGFVSRFLVVAFEFLLVIMGLR